MGKVTVLHHGFNVGVVDKKHLARVDLERNRLAAELQTNLLPLTTGPAFPRPGLEYIEQASDNRVCLLKHFVFGASDAALLEFYANSFRVRVNDVTVTRPSVTAVISDGLFNTGAGWTLSATSGATSTISGGFLNLTASARGSTASAKQTIAVAQIGVEHGLAISVDRGPVILRVGSTLGGEEYIAETPLKTGIHSLAFTPSGPNFYVELFSRESVLRRVASIEVETAGAMALVTPWSESLLDLIRLDQSANVIFAACRGIQTRRIERRNNRSWSIVLFQPVNGPFTSGRTRDTKLIPNVTEGNGTLSSADPFFTPSHVGSLFSIFHEGFRCQTSLGGSGEFTDAFQVTGVVQPSEYNDRNWEWTVSGTWVGTLRWYRSFDGEFQGYKEFRKTTGGGIVDIIANEGPTQNSDKDDNALIWYKLGFEEGSYTSGSASIVVTYSGGGGSGVCRVTEYVSPTQVEIEILSPFFDIKYSSDWREGEWSNTQLWPSAITRADGRLWLSGYDRIWGSVSDDYENFDDDVEGDSGPISRSIATGGVNDTQWLMSLQRLVAGTEGGIDTIKSSNFDEPITPTNLSLKEPVSIGSAPVEPIKIDSRGVFVDQSGLLLMELIFDGNSGYYDAAPLSKLCIDLFGSGVRQMAIQRRPDARIWVILNNGLCVCVVFEPKEEVLAFIPIETDGLFESAAVLPSADQDRVYFSVLRGSTRNIEKMALDSEVKPLTLCKVMDAFKVATPVGMTVSGASHLVGRTVVVWADGQPLTQVVDGYTVPREFVVDADGKFILPATYASVVYGLPYEVRFKSARLAYGAQGGTSVLQKKKVNSLGFILTDFVRAGIRYGAEFDNPSKPMDPMPVLQDGLSAPAIVNSAVNDDEMLMFPGDFDTDARVCIGWKSPFTATVLALVVGVETNG
jgi:hypothetical protein